VGNNWPGYCKFDFFGVVVIVFDYNLYKN